jgi:hypothetical protein
MQPHSKTASPARLTVPVMSKGVGPSSYQTAQNPATPESYPVAKIQSRFRLRIETARVICHLAGMGGAQ